MDFGRFDNDSKLAISWVVWNRDAEYAKIFMEERVARRLKNHLQLTTDGLKAFLEAIEENFEANIEFAQLIKLFGKLLDGKHRYSPAECIGIHKTIIEGHPKKKHISTSHIE